MFKVNNRNTRTRCEIRSKLTIKTAEYFRPCFSVSIVNFEKVNADWDELYAVSQSSLTSCPKFDFLILDLK